MTTTKKATTTGAAILDAMNELFAEREDFEKGLQARSNKKLWEIVAAIYAKYVPVMKDKEQLKAAVEAMTAVLSERGQRVQKNSSALSVFVRYVFNSERQTTYVYTRALQYLLSENVKPAAAAKYIEEKGGVDQCFKARAPSKEQASKKELIEQALPHVEEALSSTSKAIAKFTVKPEFVAETYNEEFTFAICRADKNGNIEVISIVPKTTQAMTNIAKNALAEFLGKHKNESDEKQKATRQVKSIEKATAKAKASKANVTDEMSA